MTSKTLQFMKLVGDFGELKHIQGQVDATQESGGVDLSRIDRLYDQIEAEVVELQRQVDFWKKACDDAHNLGAERLKSETVDLRTLLRDVYDTWVFGDLSVSLMARVKAEGLK